MAENNTSIWSQQHFALRRLHSLTGIIPVGAFLLNHMLANSTAWLGQGHFDHHIELIHSLPWLVWIEVIFIFIPLAFHGLLGLVIALQGRPNQVQYSYMDNWRYTLQRVSAYVLIPFIILHLLHYRLADWIGIAAPYADAAAAHGGAGFFVVTVAQFQAGLMGIPTWLWLVIYSIIAISGGFGVVAHPLDHLRADVENHLFIIHDKNGSLSEFDIGIGFDPVLYVSF